MKSASISPAQSTTDSGGDVHDEALEHARHMVRTFGDRVAMHAMEQTNLTERQQADIRELERWTRRLRARASVIERPEAKEAHQ